MSIKHIIKQMMFRSGKGTVFFYRIRKIREKIALLQPDDKFIGNVYKKRFGKEMNLKDPQTLSEKLQWLKLFYRHEDMPICSDKYAIREYLSKHNLDHLCNEVIGIFDDASEICFEELPDRFVAKATHGSGWNLICKDKSKLNWKESVDLMNSWLKLDLFVFGREWNYKEVKPRIVVEKFIDHEPLNDYKFMCYNGEPLYMQLNNDDQDKHFVDFYDLKTWERFPVTYTAYHRSDRDIEKPELFNQMMELARELSRPFPFVRVDFYSFDNQIILGEMTFFPGGGLRPFVPMELGYNEKLGEKLVLPEPNYNLELYRKIMKA